MTRGLTRFERRALAAIADAIVPPGGAIEAGALDVGVPGTIERWLGSFSPTARTMTRLMLAGYALTPLAGRRPRLVQQLSPSERRAWVDRSPTARFRLRRDALGGIETLVQLAYASDPSIATAIGYDGAPLLPVDWDHLGTAVRLPVVQYPDIPSRDIDADAVIVGSGAGGAVAADTLAAAGLSVVVLEEGARVSRDGFAGVPPVERLFSLYRDSGLTFTMGSPVISLPMGRAVGGTTVVNSGTCFRTPDGVLDAWSRAGIPAMAPEDLAPFFDDVEKVIGVQPVPDEVLGRNGEILRDGAAALGWSGGPIRRNIRGCHGHGVCVFGCPVDAKQAMHLSYLPRAVANGARVFANCRVERVIVEHGRAVGVVAGVHDPSDGRRHGTLRVRGRAVVLAAGAVFTPALLLRQGLANRSGQLGRNLVIHPGAGTTARFDEPLEAWRGTMQSYYVDEHLSAGILLEATFPPPGVGYSAGSLPGWGRDKELFRLYPHMAACGSIVSDGGNGSVRPLGRHGALIHYELSRADAAKVVEGVAAACELYFAAGARTVYPMLPGLPAIDSVRDVAMIREGRFPRGRLHLSAYHPMGTARMGAYPATSVVDPWCAAWDLPGLHVMDASVLPSSTHVNPQVTIMAVVARSAARLADVLG